MVKSFSKQRADQLQSSVFSVMQLYLPFELYFLVILAFSLDFSSVVTVAAEPQVQPSKAPTFPKCAGLRERQEEAGEQEGDTKPSNTSEPLSSPLRSPPLSPKVEAELEKKSVEEQVEEKKDLNEKPRKKPFWLDDDDLPPIM